MDFQELISRFAVALGIGLLIGLERGWRTREERAGSRTAGIRTFAISGVLGAVIGALSQSLGGAASAGGGVVLGLGFAAYAGVMMVFCREENRADKSFSATTAVAAMVTFALGAYALAGDMRAAAALAVATTLILAMRESIHGWVANITWPELRSGLVLLAMTFVALPIMPDEAIGPYGGVNPREIWIIAIVLAGVSFVGYIAVKYLRPSHGVLLAGAAGGLASSTAVTIANARRAAAHEGSSRLLAAGVALASTVMFLRVCAIVGALNPALLASVAPPLLAAAVVATAFALVAAYGTRQTQEIKFRNPFSLGAVVGFAFLLTVIIVLGRVVSETFGATGAILGAAVVGIADVDAVTVSMTQLVPHPLSARSAALAILAAVSADTISKILIGGLIGRGRFASEIAAMAFGCHVAAGIALWATLRFFAV